MDNERYEFLNDRIDHTDSRIDSVEDRLLAIEADREVKKSRALEWLVIALVALEAIFEVLTYYHHA